ncbi:MAG TPA: multicopper oxidase domain-containing protein [Candidatus Paceibacterota bacterium]|nr:multicopper oxidase domain-containing protein [Candidatus Paceibacterota bacterium]
MKQLITMIALVALFVGLGFVYKYNFSPSAKAARSGAVATEPAGVTPIPTVAEIGADPTAVPPPITRKESATVKIALDAIAVRSALADGVTYEYWTYNKQVPGPMIRVREGDTVEVTMTHNAAGHAHAATPLPLDLAFSGPFEIPTAHAAGDHAASDGHDDGHDAHMDAGAESGHEKHSVDLHAVLGPGGGAGLTQAGHDEVKVFSWKAMRPGLYVYHCASPHIPTHIANGMYGLVLVEPKEGLPPVDREFYVMQGEFYTAGALGEKGFQPFSKAKLMKEEPEYVVFNGRVGSLTGDRALKAKTGEKVRLYFGVGSFVPSNLHLIGGIFDKLYPEGDIISDPHRNVQTTLVPAGGAVVAEWKQEVPGTFLLVDHALVRAIDRGAAGQLVVEGEPRPDIIRAGK